MIGNTGDIGRQYGWKINTRRCVSKKEFDKAPTVEFIASKSFS